VSIFVAEFSAYLTIRFEGPEVRPGRMRLDDFIQAARDFSACAKRVAMVLQQSPSTAKGRRPEELVEALSLDIVGFTRGSPAAVAQFERSENQMGLEGLDFGEQTYRALIEGIEIAASLGDSLPPGFDLGVLMKLRDIGKLFNRGVNRMEFTLNHHVLPLKASFDSEKCDRIRQRIEQPEAQRQTIEGRLLMADFKETGRQLRVHPPVGPAITCKFPESLSAEVEECIRQFVRVSGKMQYHPSGEPQYLDITDIEPVEEATLGRTPKETEWIYSFWENPTAEEYARRQGVQPVADAARLYGTGEPEDWEGFDEALQEWRMPQPLT
jgi:hypothetical protein